MPSHTAFPTIEAICFAGAVPVFVDVDETYTVDPKDAAAKVSPRTVGFVPVHLYGHPGTSMRSRSSARNEASGSSRTAPRPTARPGAGASVGSFGRAGAFSFYPSKNLPVMGDGGLLVTDDDEVAGSLPRGFAITGASARTFTSRSASTCASTSSRRRRDACSCGGSTP